MKNKHSNKKIDILQYIYINKRVLAWTLKDEDKIQPKHIGLATDKISVKLKDGLI